MIQSQNCQLSEEAKHHWRRASAIAEDLKTRESYSRAIDEFAEVMILAPECPDVYYNLFWLYSQRAELGSYDKSQLVGFELDSHSKSLLAKLDNDYKYQQLNNAELFLKVCLALNPANQEDAKIQLARLEVKMEQITGKHEDFLDMAYDCLKKGCKDALVDRYYQLHKFISKDNSRDKFEQYFLMARSADSHYKKKEHNEAKEIYAEMLKSEFKDEYVRKKYAESGEDEIVLYFTIDLTGMKEGHKKYVKIKVLFNGKKIGYVQQDAISFVIKDPKPGKRKLQLKYNGIISVFYDKIDTRKKKYFEFSIVYHERKFGEQGLIYVVTPKD